MGFKTHDDVTKFLESEVGLRILGPAAQFLSARDLASACSRAFTVCETLNTVMKDYTKETGKVFTRDEEVFSASLMTASAFMALKNTKQFTEQTTQE